MPASQAGRHGFDPRRPLQKSFRQSPSHTSREDRDPFSGCCSNAGKSVANCRIWRYLAWQARPFSCGQAALLVRIRGGKNTMTVLRGYAICFAVFFEIAALAAAESIDMSKVRALAALPVKEILRDTPVRELDVANYWKTVRGNPRPVVVMFYSNVDPESQRLATLIRYVAIKYREKFS